MNENNQYNFIRRIQMNTKFLYTTALGAMLVLAQPVLAQTSSGGSTSGSSRTGTMSGSGNTPNGTTGDNSNVTSPSSTTTGTTSSTTTTTTGTGIGTNDIMSSNPMIDSTWSTESAYWRNHYSSRPYYNKTTKYTTYEPAYRFGIYNFTQNEGKRYEDLDMSQLKSDWDRMRGTSTLTWEQAQPAVRDAYTRMYEGKNSKSGSPANQINKTK
jgi:hypothetical protein